MKIGYVGYDVTFRGLFPLVIKEAEETRGHEKGVWLPPQIRGVAIDRMSELFDCHAVIMGLSSFQTQEELGLAEGLFLRGIPVVIIEDVPGSSLRPKAKSFAPKAAALIIALESAWIDAHDFGYQPQRIHYLGPPPHWSVSYRQMMGVDRGAARSSLTVRRGEELQPLVLDDVLVYVPGTKMPLVVNAMLRCAIDAGKALFGHRFVLGFASHPGEKPENPEEEEMFAQAFADRVQIREGVREADVSRLTNPQRYAIADLSVISGGPTESIVAAYARNTRMAYYRDENTTAFLAASGVEGGKWFVAELKAAMLIEPHNYMGRIQFLMSDVGQKLIRAQQEEHFPLPEIWDTAPVIVDLLEKVAGEAQ